MADSADTHDWVIETSDATFEQDAIGRSHQRGVVVDFWAPWCGPCRALAPVLEKLAAEYQGRFLLVKANVDEMPQVAGEFGVSSIPAVYALREGQLVEQFLGVLPEHDLRQWLKIWLPSAADLQVSTADQQAESDPAAAEAQYRAVLEQDPHNDRAKLHLARLLVAGDRTDEAQEMIDQLAARGYLEEEAETVQSQLHLQQSAGAAGHLEEYRAAVAADPKNYEAAWHLAQALSAAGEHQEALELCLRLVVEDKAGFGQQAKQQMLDLFHVLGNDSELTHTYRRRLSTSLY